MSVGAAKGWRNMVLKSSEPWLPDRSTGLRSYDWVYPISFEIKQTILHTKPIQAYLEQVSLESFQPENASSTAQTPALLIRSCLVVLSSSEIGVKDTCLFCSLETAKQSPLKCLVRRLRSLVTFPQSLSYRAPEKM